MYTLILSVFAQMPAWFRNGVSALILTLGFVVMFAGLWDRDRVELVRLPDHTVATIDTRIPWYQTDEFAIGGVILLVGCVFLIFAGQSQSEKKGYHF